MRISMSVRELRVTVERKKAAQSVKIMPALLTLCLKKCMNIDLFNHYHAIPLR
jgi:hypothetical protein